LFHPEWMFINGDPRIGRQPVLGRHRLWVELVQKGEVLDNNVLHSTAYSDNIVCMNGGKYYTQHNSIDVAN
jgi:hypothetical protein